MSTIMSRYVGTELCLGILHNCYFFGPRSQIPCLTPLSLRGKFEKVTITDHFRFASMKIRAGGIIVTSSFLKSSVFQTFLFTLKRKGGVFKLPRFQAAFSNVFAVQWTMNEMLYFPSPTSPFGSIPAALSSSVYFPLRGWFFSIFLLYFQSKI